MKTYVSKLALLFFGLSLVYSCKPGIVIPSNTPSDFAYTLHVDSTFNTNAPALQSFVHGVNGNEWLLFAGRTNQSKDNGGLHNLNANYTNKSFPPVSFNDSIFVYNVSTDTRTAISIDQMTAVLKKNFPSNYKAMKGFENVFRNSNSLVRQDKEFLYVVGGYGPANFKATGNAAKNYVTYNHVARIHVPSLISLVQGNYKSVLAAELFAFGNDKSLTSTGGELHQVGVNFYVVAGHCFGNNCTPTGIGQKYVDAAYPFTATPYQPKKDLDSIHILNISVFTPITDVIDPTVPVADDLSNFRRRDGPVIPSIYKSPANGKIQEGIAIYSGVFKAGNDNNLQAWNDAIYLHPSWANSEGRLFTEDRFYNQNNFNVYSCSSFVLYDSSSELSHTFLLGGIGNGKFSENGFLSGFTNTAVRIETNIGQYPLKSAHKLIEPGNLFTKNSENKAPFYGAEAILFANSDLPVVSAWISKSSGAWGEEETEIIDLNKINDDEIVIGYVYGGIEAFVPNPESYGPSKSRASNVVFKVILKKE
jgi:hypothetical protein